MKRNTIRKPKYFFGVEDKIGKQLFNLSAKESMKHVRYRKLAKATSQDALEASLFGAVDVDTLEDEDRKAFYEFQVYYPDHKLADGLGYIHPKKRIIKP